MSVYIFLNPELRGAYIIKGNIGKLTGTLNGRSENFHDCTKEPNYKLKKAVNQRKSAEDRKLRRFQGQIFRVLIQNNSPQGPAGLITFKILIVLLYIVVLNSACLNFAQSFVRAY